VKGGAPDEEAPTKLYDKPSTVKVATNRPPELDLMKPSAVGIVMTLLGNQGSQWYLGYLKCLLCLFLELREKGKDKELRIVQVSFASFMDFQVPKVDSGSNT